MAQIIIPPPLNHGVLSTPSKSEVTVQNTELAPGYSPGPVPQYAADGEDPFYVAEANDGEAIIKTTVYGKHKKTKKPQPNEAHRIIPPIEKIIPDIGVYMTHNEIFHSNVRDLVMYFVQIKHALAKAQDESARNLRDYLSEKDQKESYERECGALRLDLGEIRDNLSNTRDDLKASQEKLAQAISQLAALGERLETAREEKRAAVRDKNTLTRQLEDKKRELQYYQEKARKLEIALQQANDGENAANDHNTKLAALLHESERSKAQIERQKDSEEAEVRRLKDLRGTGVKITAFSAGESRTLTATDDAPTSINSDAFVPETSQAFDQPPAVSGIAATDDSDDDAPTDINNDPHDIVGIAASENKPADATAAAATAGNEVESAAAN